MKTLILLLLTNLVFSQKTATKTILHQGQTYNWRIEKIVDRDSTAVYFYLTSGITKNSNGLSIGITSVSELKLLISNLREFSNYTAQNDYYVRSDDYVLELKVNAVQAKLSDHNGGYLMLSRTSCRALSSEIENNINLMNN